MILFIETKTLLFRVVVYYNVCILWLWHIEQKKKQKNTHYSLPLPHYCILLASVILFVSTISFSAAHIFLLYSWYIERNSRIKMTWITIRNNNNDKSYMKIGWNVLLNCNLSKFLPIKTYYNATYVRGI